MMQHHGIMEIHFVGRVHDVKIEVNKDITVRQALVEAGIHPSTVLVSFEETVLPHITMLRQTVQLQVTTVSSGG